jgi:hypothetical protein
MASKNETQSRINTSVPYIQLIPQGNIPSCPVKICDKFDTSAQSPQALACMRVIPVFTRKNNE